MQTDLTEQLLEAEGEGQAAPAQANVTWCFQEASNIDISGISIIADGSGEDNAEPCNETPSLIAIGECQTPVQFTFNLVKMTLGTASFALPWGFKKAGLLGGCVGVTFVGIMVYITMSMLVSCKHTLEKRLGRHPNYAEMAEVALGRWARHLVMLATAGSCIGACAGYLTFVGELVSHQLSISQTQVVMVIAPAFAMLSLLRTYRLISFFSLLGDVSFFSALALVFYDGFSQHSHELKSPLDYPAFKPQTYMLFFGPTTFLFTIHYCMLPMESELQEPRKRVFPSLAISTAFCTIVDIAIGALGYMFYGDDTQDIVLNNLQKGPLTTMVIFLLSLELCFTYVLLLAPPRQYLEQAVLSQSDAKYAPAIGTLLRLSLVGLTIALALGVSQFGIITGFVGGLTDSLQAFILPPLLYLRIHKDSCSGGKAIALVAMALFGAGLMILTTYQNVVALRDPSPPSPLEGSEAYSHDMTSNRTCADRCIDSQYFTRFYDI